MYKSSINEDRSRIRKVIRDNLTKILNIEQKDLRMHEEAYLGYGITEFDMLRVVSACEEDLNITIEASEILDSTDIKMLDLVSYYNDLFLSKFKKEVA